MEVLRKSSEEEMIAEFLLAEVESVRFSEQLTESMKKLGIAKRLVTNANLQDETENVLRRRLLGNFRGYGENRELFERFPVVFDWRLCSFSGADMEHIRYIDYCYWNELSSGTGNPSAAAETIRKGIRIYDVSNDGFFQAAEYIKEGGRFPKLFFLTSDDEEFVIVEGHQRMTAYALVPECFRDVEVIVGRCSEDELKRWM